ncbi:Translation initiation factor IF-2 [Colletotrichum sp. SAR 10_96]|nr:Translation initiation factor IF-2 [Colletotrichum sp. SAR 10_96]
MDLSSTGTSEFTLTSTSGESTATATSTATPNPPLITVEGNTLSNLGCFGSPSGHPGFNLTLTSALMTLELCAAACPTTIQYAGVVGTECYCGNVVDSTNEVNVAEGQCDTPCPGNPDQRSGHAVTPSGSRLKRQLLSVEIRLTIFARVVGGISSTSSGASGSATISGSSTAGVNRRLVCYDGVWFPDVCDGYDCGRKIVCTNVQCEYATPGSKHYDEVVVCYGNNCEVQKCNGDACNQKYVCTDGSCGFQSGSASEAGQKHTQGSFYVKG